MPKFRYSLDSGTSWVVVDSTLPYAIPSAAGDEVTVEAIGTAVTAPASLVGGIALGSVGATGTPYEGLKFVEGDDFNSAPTRWSGRNPAGRYTAVKVTSGRRKQGAANEFAMWTDPDWRGSRNQSPVALGLDGVSVSGSRAILTASVVDPALSPILPTDFTGSGPDNKPRVISGALKTSPSFMFSGKADWAIEAKVRMEGGIIRGYWPAFWSTTMQNWPDFFELDLVEGKKDASGNIGSLMNVIGSTSDGAGASYVTVATRPFPTSRDVHSLVTKIGGTIRFYDDIATEGTLALVGTYTDARVARFRGSHDIHLDLAAGQDWDASTYNAADWPATFEIDWWRAWVPATAGDNTATVNVATIDTTPGGSWAATLPTTATLSGGKAGLEEIVGWFDNPDAPGYPTRTALRLPGGMTVNTSTRAVTGTVPMTEGGRVFLVQTFAFDDGTPSAKAIITYNVAPAVQSVFSNVAIPGGGAFSQTVAYTAFHSGNLGPHTYTATADKGWVTIAGNGTGELTISGTAPSNETATITINCTNSIGQVTTVARTVSSAVPFFNDTFTGSLGALAGTSSDSGGTWSIHPTSVDGTLRSGAGIYHPTTNPASLMINSQTPPDADYYVEGDLLVKTVIASAVSGVNGRMDGTAATFYGLRYNGSSFILFKSNAGTLTALATYTATQPTGVTAVLRLEMLGDQISGYVDGVLRCGPVTDTDITAVGKIGTRMYGSNATTSTGQHLESMRAGSL